MLYVVTESYKNMTYKKFTYFSNREMAMQHALYVQEEVDEVIVEEYIEKDGRFFIRQTLVHWGEEDEE